MMSRSGRRAAASAIMSGAVGGLQADAIAARWERSRSIGKVIASNRAALLNSGSNIPELGAMCFHKPRRRDPLVDRYRISENTICGLTRKPRAFQRH